MNKKLGLLMFVMLALVLIAAACGSEPSSSSEEPNNQEGETAPESTLSQEEVLAEIERITDQINSGDLSEEEGIEELKAVIPKPEGYPSRNIEYVVGWGEGGGSDRYARHIAMEAEKIMDTKIIINNMPGGAGEVALAYMLDQPADGYTIYGAITSQVINEALGEQPYSFTEETTFIIRNQGATEVFWVREDSPFETWDDLVEHAKQNEVTFTGAGSPGDDELRIAELVQQLGDVKFTYIPSQESGERVASLLGGHIDVLHETAGAVIDLYHDGQIRPILIPSDVPFEGIDAPTTADYGLTVSVGRWRGINAPGGLDPEIQQYLHNVFYAASLMPGYKQYEKESYLDIVPGYLNSEDYEKAAKEEVEIVREMLRDLGYIE
ncbi:tripartite-type tricarboxylate transporter receptor subunit TctC [Caldalkalibacillus uzonensis]|uniref:Tripartite-type tricarboxylate transporter receptor subunit TctC n=1 Tax=Caldalkalibacillus uzonensis TaxID=353224 RepID=A0ABU0CQN7_9BACI|nr:tripartite tricarboxylate transporter substrate-binding protein [Caldalkalibacillus uzonensis]MDQ0338209.1 tripartite-type tricarboxylate transporter receptor subunit TctC [Caldalkalibacillus uzonensis]